MAWALLSPFVIGWLPVETSLESVKAIENMKIMRDVRDKQGLDWNSKQHAHSCTQAQYILSVAKWTTYRKLSLFEVVTRVNNIRCFVC